MCLFVGPWAYNHGMVGAEYEYESSHGYMFMAFVAEAQR